MSQSYKTLNTLNDFSVTPYYTRPLQEIIYKSQ